MRLLPALAAALVLSLVAAQAQATLISENDVTFGANSITFDDATGLRWLDLTVTNFQSYSSVVAQQASGGTYAGYRFATRSEVEQLFSGQGVQTVAGIPVSQLYGSGGSSVLGATTLISLLGTTVFQAPGGFFGFFDSSTVVNAEAYRLALSGSTTTVGTFNHLAKSSTTSSPFGFGSFLVQVPEPGTALLLSAGMLGLATWRRRPLCSAARGIGRHGG
jgi:hypothetical protein